MFPLLLGLITAICVFMHGEIADTSKYQLPVRIAATAIVTAIITFTAYGFLSDWRFVLLTAVSTAAAFCWGPEIGWNREVLKTQAWKGAWLGCPILPFGLIYGALRPLAYWIGYRKFADKYPDEIARVLSGISLGFVISAALLTQ